MNRWEQSRPKGGYLQALRVPQHELLPYTWPSYLCYCNSLNLRVTRAVDLALSGCYDDCIDHFETIHLQMHPSLLRYLKCHRILITRDIFFFLRLKRLNTRTTFLKDSFIVIQNNCCDLVSHWQSNLNLSLIYKETGHSFGINKAFSEENQLNLSVSIWQTSKIIKLNGYTFVCT